MLPLFKSHYSVGKSILTLTHPNAVTEGAPASIFSLASKAQLNKVVLVEDSLVGFLEAKKVSEELGLQLIFGLRMDICDNISMKPRKTSTSGEHKLIVFALDGVGCILLNKIYSFAQTEGCGRLDTSALKRFYDSSHLKIAVPFYDSFLFHNSFSYKEPCLLDHSFFDPVFFIEENHLPFDLVLAQIVEEYCEKKLPIEKVKTIYYENREDFEAYQTYKCICGRGFSTKAKSLDMPNLDHCGSPEFCFESYLDHESS